MDGGYWIGLEWIGYLRPDQFLDHLTVIKMSGVGMVISQSRNARNDIWILKSLEYNIFLEYLPYILMHTQS